MSDAPTADRVRVEFVPYRELVARGRLGLAFEQSLAGDAQTAALEQLQAVERVHVLVSLLTPEERARLAAVDLFRRARAADLELFELPLMHGRASPGELASVVTRMFDALEQGLNVVVLARGSLWRAGLVLGACLVAFGHTPARSMRSVRSMLGGLASDAGDHEALLAAFAREWRDGAVAAPRSTDRVSPARAPALPRFTGCLLGGALGDALAVAGAGGAGADPGEDAPERPAARLEVSLAVPLALSVADGMIRGLQRARECDRTAPEESVLLALARFVTGRDAPSPTPRSSRARAGDAHRGITAEAMHALRGLALEPHSRLPQEPTNESRDPAALVFAGPIALASRDREQAFRTALTVARWSHGHPQAFLSCGYLAAVLFDLVRETPLARALELADQLLKGEPGSGPLLESLAAHPLHAARETDTHGEPGAVRSAEEALGLALECFAQAAPLSDDRALAALESALSRGGESPAAASVAGQLLGAALGPDWLPAERLRALELGDLVRLVAEDLHAVAIADVELDFRRYPPDPAGPLPGSLDLAEKLGQDRPHA